MFRFFNVTRDSDGEYFVMYCVQHSIDRFPGVFTTIIDDTVPAPPEFLIEGEGYLDQIGDGKYRLRGTAETFSLHGA